MSRFCFLRRGVTNDFLKSDGKIPEESERLTMSVMMGASIETQSLRMDVGMGSRRHCLFGDFRISLVISEMSVGRKCSSGGGLRAG